MKPARFDYHRAASLPGASEMLAELGDDAKVLAGGQSLIAMMNFRLARPAHLVDIAAVRGHDRLEFDERGLRIGALATHHQVERSRIELSANGFGVIAEAMPFIGHLPIRTRGTVGGSLAHADATAEWCMLAILLDAEVLLTSIRGERTVAAREFFFGFYSTAIEPDEIIVALRFPQPAPHAGIAEYARRHGDFAVIAAAATLRLTEDGQIAAGDMVIAGIEPVPRLMPEVSEVLHAAGEVCDDLVDACAAAALGAFDWSEHADADYLAGVLTTQIGAALAAAVPMAVTG